MQKSGGSNESIGCLMIDGVGWGGDVPLSLKKYLKDHGVKWSGFTCEREMSLHAALQNALFRVRTQSDCVGIIATDGGMEAALALSAQLPVDKLVLWRRQNRKTWQKNGLKRPMRRIERFARHNRAFCISDVLLIEDEDAVAQKALTRLRRELVNARVTGPVRIAGESVKLWTDCEWTMNNGIYRFLTGQEFANELAENSEMCIIYE